MAHDHRGLPAAPTAATVSARVMLGILRNPVAMERYEDAIERSLTYAKDASALPGATNPDCALDKAMVNVGAQFAGEVAGRISIEVDPRLAGDAEAVVAKVEHLVALSREMGVGADRLLFKIPATWEGIQAAKALEARNINCLMTLVYSFAQCAAAAQAGVSLVQLYVGRVRDWCVPAPGTPPLGRPTDPVAADSPAGTRCTPTSRGTRRARARTPARWWTPRGRTRGSRSSRSASTTAPATTPGRR